MLITLNRGFKFKIKPTPEQKQFLLKSFGCTRKLYNLYIDQLYTYLEKENYVNGPIKGFKTTSPATLKKVYPYMKEIDSLALCNAEIHFKTALQKFNAQPNKTSYTKRSLKREKTLGIKPSFKDLKGLPIFKSLKKNDFSYTTNNQSLGGKWSCIRLEKEGLFIPKLKTPIQAVQHRPLP